MIGTFILDTFIYILQIVLYPFPTVNSLPFHAEVQLAAVGSMVRAVIEYLPFLEVPFALFLTALGIKFLLISWQWLKWLIELVRG